MSNEKPKLAGAIVVFSVVLVCGIFVAGVGTP
jgi:hypothetical protein